LGTSDSAAPAATTSSAIPALPGGPARLLVWRLRRLLFQLAQPRAFFFIKNCIG
jgi:hypothetical protein